MDGADPTRVLVLGASGLLGAALVPTLRDAGLTPATPTHAEADIRDLDALRAVLRDARPQLVVNCAALSKPDQAEQQPDEAFAVNAVGAHNVALAAREADVTLMHISTDYVFDGARRAPYREYHETGMPPSQYGQSKLAGEQLVRSVCPRHFITRVAALYGPGRPHFLQWILERSDPAAPLRIVADRFVSPTWTQQLARQLLVLLRSSCYGTYHAAGRGVASWYELARSALRLAGRDPEGVVPVADAELQNIAPRAPYTALENHLLRLRGLETLAPWREALAEYLRDRATPPARP
jgi:dTDP-4-dehydrorhamnose reductase